MSFINVDGTVANAIQLKPAIMETTGSRDPAESHARNVKFAQHVELSQTPL